MAWVGPIVRNEVFFFGIILGAAAILVLREWMAARGQAASNVSDAAERRRVRTHMSGPKRARRARALLATLLFCGFPGTAEAHPIHSTLTEIIRAADGTVSVRVRTFADDFSAAIARYVKGVQRKDRFEQ